MIKGKLLAWYSEGMILKVKGLLHFYPTNRIKEIECEDLKYDRSAISLQLESWFKGKEVGIYLYD